MQFKDILDIIIVAFLMYQVYRLMKGSLTLKIFFGLLLLYLLWRWVQTMEMYLLTGILGRFIDVGFIGLIVIFQPEIRRFLLMIGSPKINLRKDFLKPFGINKNKSIQLEYEYIIKAVESFSAQRTGAILVIARDSNLDYYIQSGLTINAKLSTRLLQTIFQKNSPLHDGAAIVQGNIITACSAILPVSENSKLPLQFGLRHRAALGIAEKTDAVAIAVSEERGKILMAHDENLWIDISLDELEKKLKVLFKF